MKREALLDGVVQKSGYIVWKVIQDRGILLNLKTGSYFDVDPVGLAIWGKCDGKTPVREIAQGVAREFRADLTRVLPDVLEFVRQLRHRQIVQIPP